MWLLINFRCDVHASSDDLSGIRLRVSEMYTLYICVKFWYARMYVRTYVCMLYVCMYVCVYVCRSTGTQSSTKGFGGKYSLRINIGPHEVMRDSASLSIVHYSCMYVCMYVCMT